MTVLREVQCDLAFVSFQIPSVNRYANRPFLRFVDIFQAFYVVYVLFNNRLWIHNYGGLKVPIAVHQAKFDSDGNINGEILATTMKVTWRSYDTPAASTPDDPYDYPKTCIYAVNGYSLSPYPAAKLLNYKKPNMSDETYHKYLSKNPSDVTLIIDDTKLPAHRAILSKRSEYFRAMFSNNFIEAKFDNITLKETNLKTFKIVLNYIYNGNFVFNNNRFTLDEYFQILTCAQYYVVDKLVEKIIHYFKCRDHFLILDKALKYQVEQLISSCTDWIKRQRCFETLFKNFNNLSPMTVEYFLKLKLCLNIAEAFLFKTLVGWMRANPVHSSLFSDLLEYIDLILIEEEQFMRLFEPTLLIDRSFCENLLIQQQEKANTPQKIVNQNVINNMRDLRVVEGSLKLDDNSDDVPCFNSSTFAKCATVDLKEQFLLNCLKLNLWSTSSYTVLVSTDMRHWELVIDRLNYKCDGRQVLYFAERAVRFIRFQALSSFYFSIQVDIEALYSTEPFEIDPATMLLIPKHNIAPTEMLKWKTNEHGETTGKFVEGLIDDGCVRHKVDGGSIVFRWSQPYLIGSLKFLLKEESSYAVQVKATGDASTWKYVWSESNVTGWRAATFKKQPVMYVRIVGRRLNSEYFDLYKLECPASIL